jgi:hypothetical protein
MLCRRDFGPKQLMLSLHAEDKQLIGQWHANTAGWDAGSSYTSDYAAKGQASADGPTYAMQGKREVQPGTTCSGDAGLHGAASQYTLDCVPATVQVRRSYSTAPQGMRELIRSVHLPGSCTSGILPAAVGTLRNLCAVASMSPTACLQSALLAGR